MKNKILILIVIILVVIIGGYAYVKIQNGEFLKFPSYLPDKVQGDPLQKGSQIGSPEFSPIIRTKYYQYFCGEGGINLTIYQAQKDKGFDYNPAADSLQPHMILSFGSVGDKAFYARDFSLVESRQLEEGKYRFKKYSATGAPYKAYELFWNTDKLDLSIQSNNNCVSESIADSELVRIAESMNH